MVRFREFATTLTKQRKSLGKRLDLRCCVRLGVPEGLVVTVRYLCVADSEALDSPYNHIYGRLRIPTRAYIPPQPRTMYIGEWD